MVSYFIKHVPSDKMCNEDTQLEVIFFLLACLLSHSLAQAALRGSSDGISCVYTAVTVHVMKRLLAFCLHYFGYCCYCETIYLRQSKVSYINQSNNHDRQKHKHHSSRDNA